MATRARCAAGTTGCAVGGWLIVVVLLRRLVEDPRNVPVAKGIAGDGAAAICGQLFADARVRLFAVRGAELPE